VTDFRSPYAVTGRRDLAAVVANAPDRRFAALELVAADAESILALLGLDRAALGRRLIVAPDAGTLVADLAANRGRLAFLRAGDVSPAVAALAWGDRALFGFGRVPSLADWPLTITVPAAAAPSAAYDPAAAWTLFAAGDILLDRGVELAMRGSPRGAHFPFDGGTVDITGRCRDCSPFGWDLPYVRRTGQDGAMRARIGSADLAIANFENPAPDRFRLHRRGTVFSANPARIEGLVAAGLDWVSLANNHIGDAGRAGILQTMANLDEAGLRNSGAGRNARDARTPATFEVGGRTIALLAYDAIAGVYAAGRDSVGSARLTAAALKADVARAREDGADVVIVFPHWGVEYDATPSASQQRLARLAIDAGADMVIGNHAHWAAAMETYKGRPIWYALGNFVFDQTWSELTMEGITLELTFSGSRLVQARMQPHLILDRAQPNLLDPAGDGRVVLGQVFDASEGLLDW